MTDAELREAIKEARRLAEPIGPLHALWDAIFDAEAILRGQHPLLARREVEEVLAKYLKRPRAKGIKDDVRPGPGRWAMIGSSLDDLTLNADPPSGARSIQLTSGCGWHGFITDGQTSDA